MAIKYKLGSTTQFLSYFLRSLLVIGGHGRVSHQSLEFAQISFFFRFSLQTLSCMRVISHVRVISQCRFVVKKVLKGLESSEVLALQTSKIYLIEMSKPKKIYICTAPKWVPIWGPGSPWGPFFRFWVPRFIQ